MKLSAASAFPHRHELEARAQRAAAQLRQDLRLGLSDREPLLRAAKGHRAAATGSTNKGHRAAATGSTNKGNSAAATGSTRATAPLLYCARAHNYIHYQLSSRTCATRPTTFTQHRRRHDGHRVVAQRVRMSTRPRTTRTTTRTTTTSRITASATSSRGCSESSRAIGSARACRATHENERKTREMNADEKTKNEAESEKTKTKMEIKTKGREKQG